MKSNKSVLLISWSFPPVKSPRSIKAEAIVKGFSEKYQNVYILTRQASATYLNKYYPEVRHFTLNGQQPKTLDINLKNSERLSLDWLKRKINGLLLKLFNYPDIVIFFRILRGLREMPTKSFDFCISIDGPQPMQWAVAYMRWRKKIHLKVWISDNGDPLTRNLPGNMVAPYFKIIEDFFCMQADIITVPVREGFSYFKARFASKIRVVRHSLIFPSTKLELSKPHVKQSTSTISFAYAGNMMPYQSQAKSFFSYLASLSIPFKFHIYGANAALVDSLIEKHPILQDKIVQKGLIERMQLLNELKKFSFLVYFPYANTGQVPFKLIDYAFTGLPVLGYSGRDNKILDQFIQRNYSGAEPLPDYENYNYLITSQVYADLLETHG